MNTNEPIPYDVQWKQVIVAYFDAFVAFFLPKLAKDMDYNKDPVFMDKELHKLVADKVEGKREGDQLVKVFLKNGKEQWIFVHVEVQSYHDTDFALRMYTTNYRVWDKHQVNILAIAIFTTKSKMIKEYKRVCYDTELSYKYKNYYIKDQKGREAELEASNNPFALLVLASLYAHQTDGKDANSKDQRLTFKKKLIRLLVEKGYKKKSIKELFLFIHIILRLPEDLDIEFITYTKKITKMSSNSVYNESVVQLLKAMNEGYYGKTVESLEAQYKKELEEKDNTIAEKDNTIAEKDNTIAEKDNTIAEKDNALAEKDNALAEKDNALAEKDKEVQQAIAEKMNLIRSLYEDNTISDYEKLAALFKVDVAFIESALNNNKG